MLNIYFGNMEEAIYNPAVYFKNTYQDSWITNERSKAMIKDVDKSTVIAPRIIESPVLGAITPRELSGGVKTLILIDQVPDKVFNASTCGDNCAHWLLKMGMEKNITINLNKYKISYTNIPVYVKHGNLTITGSGTIEEIAPDFGAILVKGSDNVSDKNYSVVNVDENIKLTGWAPVFIDQNKNKAYGVNVKLNGVELNSVEDASNNAGSGIYLNGSITDTENAPVINVTSTNITSKGNGIYLAV